MSREYGIPRKTLRKHRDKTVQKPGVIVQGRFRPYLGLDHEALLVAHSAVQKPGHIVAKKGAKEVGRMTSGERGKNVTVLCALNTGGNYKPPMFIFPRQRMAEWLMRDAPTGAVALCNPSGWADSESFFKWPDHFVFVAKPTPEERHLLILDGHHSHKTLAAIDFVTEHGIYMITLPPHSTHKMQPLGR